MQAFREDVAGLAAVAAALGRSQDWLRRNWLKIHREFGFPRKHPTGWTWPRAAVRAWLAAAPHGFEGPANDNAAPAPEEIWAAALDERYGARP